MVSLEVDSHEEFFFKNWIKEKGFFRSWFKEKKNSEADSVKFESAGLYEYGYLSYGSP